MSAFLKLRGEGPAFLLESAEQGKRFGRYSFIGFRPREVLRWNLGDGGDPYALAAAAVGRYSQAPLEGLPPFSGGAVGYFGYDLVRSVEPLAQPGPDAARAARHGADAERPARDLRQPQAHRHDPRQRLRSRPATSSPPPTRRRSARSRRCASVSPGRCRSAVARAAAAAAGVPLEHDARALRGERRADHRIHLRRRRLPGRALAALVGAGRRRAPSRSTAACARSTRARTCTSSTSGTSRSPAPAPSR